jgi:hypothetical protein
VPFEVQAELLAKAAKYDRNFAVRAGGVARVLILERAGVPSSEGSARIMAARLAEAGNVGGLPVELVREAFVSVSSAKSRVAALRPCIVWLAPGLDEDVTALAVALRGTSVLTAGAVPEYPPLGVVLGFRLQEGKPRMLVHLGQARAQAVDFHAAFLNLVEVVG